MGAVLASASAITADYFGAARLPPQLATMRELPSALHHSLKRQSAWSVVIIGILTLV